jgi:hypothetical protein
VKNTDMLSSNVVGLDVYNGEQAKVGKIQDIAFDNRLYLVSRRLPRHGHALCRGQSGCGHGLI